MNTMPARLLPSDPLFPFQWHLLNTGTVPDSIAGFDINVITVWPDYTGRGVLVGIMDQGIDPTHPDLVHSYRHDLSWDTELNQPGGDVKLPDDSHGTPVAGLIAAAAHNGQGGVGVAWNAEVVMYRNTLAEGITDPEVLLVYETIARKILESGVDVWNNSWTPSSWPFSLQAFQGRYNEVAKRLTEEGRDGLGVLTIFSAGNNRTEKFDTNDSPSTAMPWTLTIAASSERGDITSYSTAGASVLVTAPGSDPASIVTTDRQGSDGYNTQPGAAGDYTNAHDAYFGGTSSASPIAAGVVALMLEANPRLGYRDIQEALVYSSRRATFLDQNLESTFNGARDWNGGALLTGHDFGFGHIDAHAAVRLAETWTHTGTATHLVTEQGQVRQQSVSLGAGETRELSAWFAPAYRVEHMTVSVKLETQALQALTLELISPDGTASTLINRPPVFEPYSETQTPSLALPSALEFTMMTVRNWGESLAGDWTLRLSNADDGAPLTLSDWSLQAYTAGNEKLAGTQIFTNEFARFAREQTGRTELSSDHGQTINAAALTSNTVLNLATGQASISGVAASLTDPQNMKHLFSGDGDDTLVGNAHSNVLLAGRGSNSVDGGAGVDVLRLIGTSEGYQLRQGPQGLEIDSLMLSGGGTDRVYNTEVLHFADQVVLAHKPQSLTDTLFDAAGYLSWNPDVAQAVSDGRVADAYQHYTQWGTNEGRDPNALFSEAWYLQHYTDVASAVGAGRLQSGFQHYMQYGWLEGRSPAAWMNAGDYLQRNADVAAAGLNPLGHYLQWGIDEGRTLTALDVDLWG